MGFMRSNRPQLTVALAAVTVFVACLAAHGQTAEDLQRELQAMKAQLQELPVACCGVSIARHVRYKPLVSSAWATHTPSPRAS